MSQWFKHTLPGGRILYSPFPKVKQVAFALGDGKLPPEPGQIAETLNAAPDSTQYQDGGFFRRMELGVTDEVPVELPPGSYRYGDSWEYGEHLAPKPLRDDTYIGISTIYDPMATEIRDFIANREVYDNDKIKVLHRLGMLLVGPPGNGKTSLIRELAYREMPEDAVIIFMPGLPSDDFVHALNDSTVGRIKLVVFEELAAQLDYMPIEPFLNFMDGENSMNDTITIGTTNYPQWLPPSVLERTSRFDLLFYMDNPTAEERRAFLESFGGLKIVDTDIEQTEGMSISDLREIVLSALRRKQTIAEAIAVLNERKAPVDRILGRDRSEPAYRLRSVTPTGSKGQPHWMRGYKNRTE